MKTDTVELGRALYALFGLCICMFWFYVVLYVTPLILTTSESSINLLVAIFFSSFLTLFIKFYFLFKDEKMNRVSVAKKYLEENWEAVLRTQGGVQAALSYVITVIYLPCLIGVISFVMIVGIFKVLVL